MIYDTKRRIAIVAIGDVAGKIGFVVDGAVAIAVAGKIEDWVVGGKFFGENVGVSCVVWGQVSSISIGGGDRVTVDVADGAD